eukprot:1159572-Pelagomonas_calceolata.AAC.1
MSEPAGSLPHLGQARAGVHHDGQLAVLTGRQQGLLQGCALAGSSVLEATAVEDHAAALAVHLLGDDHLQVDVMPWHFTFLKLQLKIMPQDWLPTPVGMITCRLRGGHGQLHTQATAKHCGVSHVRSAVMSIPSSSHPSSMLALQLYVWNSHLRPGNRGVPEITTSWFHTKES